MQIIKKSTSAGYRTDALTIEMNAADVTNHVVRRIHDIIVQSMYEGRAPNGKRKPKARTRNSGLPRGVTDFRKFVDSIKRTKSRGTRKAKASINYSSFFRPWILKEKKRGIDHLGVPEKEVDRILKAYLDNMVK